MKTFLRTALFITAALAVLTLPSCGNKETISGTAADITNAYTDADKAVTEDSMFTYFDKNYTFDSASITAAATAENNFDEIWSGAFYNDAAADGNYSLTVDMTLDSLYSSAGLLFNAGKSEVRDGIEGYALTVRDRKLYLLELGGYSKLTVNELARHSLEDYKKGSTLRLKVERIGNTCRMYYLDDMDGVEPWAEFEFVLTDFKHRGTGVIDNGHGAHFSSLRIESLGEEKKGERLYRNPVFSEAQAADPGVLFHDGVYYCYSTSAPIGYYVYTSTDLVNWKNEGLCCDMAWGFSRNGYYWAPEVVEKNGKFYMIMSVEEHLGFAVADSPLGPFIPEKKWLFDKTIDGHIFIDDDGAAYLFYVSWRDGHEYGIYACALEDDIVTVKPNTEVHIMSPKDSWEKKDGAVCEGPFVLKHNGLYYMTYSGTGYTSPDYAVGYAISESPLGEYTRYDGNPVLSRTSRLHGPGHHSFTVSPAGSELIIVYHVHNSTTEVHPRKICIDRARFVPTASGVDRLEIYGPTHTSQEYPK